MATDPIGRRRLRVRVHRHRPRGSGHRGRWALNNPERIANWGHVGVHRTAETAKAIVRAYYGRDPARAYFMGCSNGGRQALMEAQRYPQDFDGLICRRSCLRHHQHRRRVHQEHQGGVPDAGQRADAGGHARQSGTDPTCRARRLRRIGWRPRHRHRLAAAVQVLAVRDQSVPDDAAAADCLTRAQRQAIETIYAPAVSAGKRDLPGPASRRRERRERMAAVDHRRRRRSARGHERPGIEPSARLRPRSVQVLHVRAIRRGTTRPTTSRTSPTTRRRWRRSSMPTTPILAASRSAGESDHLAWVGRSGAERERARSTTTAASSSATHTLATTAGCTCSLASRTATAVPARIAWSGSTRWSIGSSTARRRSGLSQEDRRRPAADPHTAGCPISAACGLQGNREH